MKLNKIIQCDGKEVFIGIDVHKRQYTVCCRVDGELVKRVTMGANPLKLLEFIQKYFQGAKVVNSVYEAGFSGFHLHRFLISQGIRNIVVHAGSVEVSTKKVKTDKRDAARLAEQLEAGRLRCIYIPNEGMERQRLISRTRSQLVKARSRCIVQITMKFYQFGLIESNDESRMTINRVAAIIAGKNVSEELRVAVGVLLETWQHLSGKISQLESFAESSASRLVKLYKQAPGVGDIIALKLAHELGDMSQFRNERVLFSYLGLTPSLYNTDKTYRQGHITKEGKAELRHCLIEAAWVAIKKDKILAEAFARIAHRAGKKRAIVAIARKLIGRVRAAIKKEEEYRLNYREAA